VVVVSVVGDHWARALPSGRIHGWLSIVHRCNSGVSWSLGAGHGTWALVGASAIALVVAIAASRSRPGMATWGSGLIVGGAVGNLLSRLTSTQRCVTDYLAVGRFFVANIQDVAITMGVLLWAATFLQKDEPRGR
jgi:signal peptidase II